MWLVASVVITLLLAVAIHLGLRRRRPLSRMPEREDRRRGSRVALATPVFVYGWLLNEPFSENTETLNVSAVGGLIQLSAIVIPLQELILTNLKTNKDLPCRVARSIRSGDGKTLVGVDFLQPSPNFWQIDFVSNSPRSFIEMSLTHTFRPTVDVISDRDKADLTVVANLLRRLTPSTPDECLSEGGLPAGLAKFPLRPPDLPGLG
jgi:hypothetical protein